MEQHDRGGVARSPFEHLHVATAQVEDPAAGHGHDRRLRFPVDKEGVDREQRDEQDEHGDQDLPSPGHSGFTLTSPPRPRPGSRMRFAVPLASAAALLTFLPGGATNSRATDYDCANSPHRPRRRAISFRVPLQPRRRWRRDHLRVTAVSMFGLPRGGIEGGAYARFPTTPGSAVAGAELARLFGRGRTTSACSSAAAAAS